jgi:hypothetical protein
MNIQDHIYSLTKLGKLFNDIYEELGSENNTSLPNYAGDLNVAIEEAHKSNGWFTKENILFSMEAWSQALKEEKIVSFSPSGKPSITRITS